jgi:transposase
MKKRYRVTLTEEEHNELLSITQKGTNKAQKIRNAIILLNCDEGEFSDKKSNSEIANMLRISDRTIERVKKNFVEESFEIALNGKPYKTNVPPKIDGEVEAKLIALACSESPDGYNRWSLRLLAEKMVQLQYIVSISHEGVRQVLKKTNLSPGKNNVS